MAKMILFTAPRQVGFEDYEERTLESNEVRLRTLYSGISSGTELTAYRRSNPYMHKRWEPERKLFLPVPLGNTSLEYPVRGWGYEEVGEVVEVGSAVQDISPGARVFGMWGHKT